MNRIINDPDRVVDDAVRGYLRAHADLVAATGNPRVIRHRAVNRTGFAGGCFG